MLILYFFFFHDSYYVELESFILATIRLHYFFIFVWNSRWFPVLLFNFASFWSSVDSTSNLKSSKRVMSDSCALRSHAGTTDSKQLAIASLLFLKAYFLWGKLDQTFWLLFPQLHRSQTLWPWSWPWSASYPGSQRTCNLSLLSTWPLPDCVAASLVYLFVLSLDALEHKGFL
jgi:hypothetical protein